MAKWKYIRNDTYRRGITIFIGNNKEYINFLKNSTYRNDNELIEGASTIENRDALACCYNDNNDGQCIIYLPFFPETPAQIACLGHELLHAVFHILSWCGVKYSDESEEAFTYLYEFFLNKALTEKGYKDV